MDPFATALDALFNAPGSAAAVYLLGDGVPQPIRVIRSQPDDDVPFGGGRTIMATNIIEIRRSEVAEPARGAMLTIGTKAFVLQGDARLDVEGLTWTVGAEAA